MNSNQILSFIGSKWFMLGLGIVMLLFLPTTYNNFIVVYEAQQMSSFWYIPMVFLMNLFSTIMAFYKSASMFFSKENNSLEWD